MLNKQIRAGLLLNHILINIFWGGYKIFMPKRSLIKFFKATFLFSILLISIRLKANNRIMINTNSYIEMENCKWIPIDSKSFKSLVYRLCKTSNNNIYEIKYNLRLEKLIYSKLIGNLDSPLVFKDKKNYINQNQDTLKYSKLINGDFYIYNCQRITCNPIPSRFKRVGIKKYFWH